MPKESYIRDSDHRAYLRLVKASGGYVREYGAWLDMLSRCYNPDDPDYPEHGGRGIQVCDRWRDSFEHFLEDMGPMPAAQPPLDLTN